MTQAKAQPIRMCVICRGRHPQAELHRWVRNAQGEWQADPGRKHAGRGAWMCTACATKADVKQLRRPFRQQAERIHHQLQQREGGASAALEG
jgi:predicted RNA-binding protein YlxR (DUF448 family)